MYKIVLNYFVDNVGERGEKLKRGWWILLCVFIINIIIECMNGIKLLIVIIIMCGIGIIMFVLKDI